MKTKNIVIESGKDMPPGGKPGRRRIYPFAEMNIGDSFHAPGVSYQSVASSVKWFQGHQEEGQRWEFKIRNQTVDGKAGVGVWRVT